MLDPVLRGITGRSLGGFVAGPWRLVPHARVPYSHVVPTDPYQRSIDTLPLNRRAIGFSIAVKRLLSLVVVLVTATAPLELSVEASPPASDFSGTSASVEERVIPPEFVRFGVTEFPDLRLENAVAVPERGLLFGTWPDEGRFVTLDIVTGRLRAGDQVPFYSSAVVAGNGRAAYLSESAAGAEQISRIDLDTLRSTPVTNVSDIGLGEESTTKVALLGDSDAVVMATRNGIAAIVDGVMRPSIWWTPDALPLGLSIAALAPLDETRAVLFAGTDQPGREIYIVTVGDSGVESVEPIASDDGATFPFVVRPGEIVTAQAVYDTDGRQLRDTTPFDLARDDPSIPLRYSWSDNRLTIFDAMTGSALVSGDAECGQLDGFVMLGDGRVATGFSVATRILDLAAVCGSLGEFTSLPPTRLLDTRIHIGADGRGRQPVEGGETIRVHVAGNAGVPVDAHSVVVNVTGVRFEKSPNGLGFVTVWPSGLDRPTVASLNLIEGNTLGNSVSVKLGADGSVDLFNSVGAVHLVVDVFGFYSSTFGTGGSRFVPLRPQRMVDTRIYGGRLGPSESFTAGDLSIGATVGDITPGAVAIVANVTAINPTTTGFLRLHADGSPLPEGSSMNFPAGRNVNRLVTIDLAGGTDFEVWNSAGTVDIAIDIVGYYADNPGGMRFLGLAPYREFDSRASSPFDGDGSIPPGAGVEIRGYSPGLAIVANLTAVRPDGPGFATAIALQADLPPRRISTSNLNFSGSVTGNQAIINLPSDIHYDGDFVLYSSERTHLVVDVFGLFG